MFQGSIVALVTPMLIGGEIDYVSLAKLVDFHLENNTDGLVILGTTGESPTVTADEHRQMISSVLKQVAGRMPVISGVGTNSTELTIRNAQADTELGVDALLIATPYYNKPTQEGLYQHYKSIAEAVDNKLILYNVPGRSVVDMLPVTVARLAEIENIIGIKETVDVARTQQLRALLPADFAIYCGDDPSNLDMLQAGAQGLISVTANVAPQLLHEMCLAYQVGDLATAEQIHQQLMPLHNDLFIESNPIPVKFALAQMGLINCGIRLPLTWLSDAQHQVVLTALKAAQIGE